MYNKLLYKNKIKIKEFFLFHDVYKRENNIAQSQL
jgi:hypothetical protein